MACEEIYTDLAALRQKRKNLQNLFQSVGSADKHYFDRQISQINRAIRAKQTELNACLYANGIRSSLFISDSTPRLTTLSQDTCRTYADTVMMILEFEVGRTSFR